MNDESEPDWHAKYWDSRVELIDAKGSASNWKTLALLAAFAWLMATAQDCRNSTDLAQLRAQCAERSGQ